MKNKLIGILTFVLAITMCMQNMVLADTGTTANQTSAKVLVNGVMTEFEAYNIGGNNYFKLRDIAAVINGSEKQFEVTWDGIKKAINLLSSAPYTPVGAEMSQGDGKRILIILMLKG